MIAEGRVRRQHTRPASTKWIVHQKNGVSIAKVRSPTILSYCTAAAQTVAGLPLRTKFA